MDTCFHTTQHTCVSTQLTYNFYFVYTHIQYTHIVYCIHTSVCWLHSLLRCANMCLFVYVYTHNTHMLYIATQLYIFCIVYTHIYNMLIFPHN